MAEQITYEFFTIHGDQAFVDSEQKKQEYGSEKAAGILGEAAAYRVRFIGKSQEWYEDEESCWNYTKPVDPETILVKDDKFYGCVLKRTYSSWSYRDMTEGEKFTTLTIDKPETNVEDIDHSTQNGDSYSITDAYLEKIE